MVYTLFVALFIANILLLFIALIMIRSATHIVKTSRAFIFPIVLMLAIMGSYVTDSRLFDVWLTLIFGILGYGMRKLKIPLKS